MEAAKYYGATDIINYKDGDIVAQIMDKTHGRGVDKVIVAGGDNDTFIQAVTMLKPGGRIGNVNYLGSGDYVRIPRVEWGCGMGHKTIAGGLMPAEGSEWKNSSLSCSTAVWIPPVCSRIVSRASSIWRKPSMLMKDKPRDLIKPVVVL